jgi:hypothetical protein
LARFFDFLRPAGSGLEEQSQLEVLLKTKNAAASIGVGSGRKGLGFGISGCKEAMQRMSRSWRIDLVWL